MIRKLSVEMMLSLVIWVFPFYLKPIWHVALPCSQCTPHQMSTGADPHLILWALTCNANNSLEHLPGVFVGLYYLREEAYIPKLAVRWTGLGEACTSQTSLWRNQGRQVCGWTCLKYPTASGAIPLHMSVILGLYQSGPSRLLAHGLPGLQTYLEARTCGRRYCFKHGRGMCGALGSPTIRAHVHCPDGCHCFCLIHQRARCL